MGDLKLIYRAETEDKASDGLKKLQEKWDAKYPLAVRSWANHWEHVKTFFKYLQEIRTIIYPTNAVESLHRQFRKVTKNRAVFPNDGALLKWLYLAVSGLSEKWTTQLHGWKQALSQFAILFENRMEY